MKRITSLIVCACLLGAFLHTSKVSGMISMDVLNHPDVIKVEEMIDKTGANVPAVTKKRVALAIAENARYYGIKPKNLVAIAFVESTFRPNLINEAGDYGIFQLNEKWSRPFWGNTRKSELLNIYKNTEIACRMIKYLEEKNLDVSYYHSFRKIDRNIYRRKIKNVTILLS